MVFAMPFVPLKAKQSWDKCIGAGCLKIGRKNVAKDLEVGVGDVESPRLVVVTIARGWCL